MTSRCQITAIANKAIELIVDGGLFENLRHVSPHFHARLSQYREHPFIGEVRGIGLMAALEVVEEDARFVTDRRPIPARQVQKSRQSERASDHGCRVGGSRNSLCFSQFDGVSDRASRKRKVASCPS